MAQKFLNTDEVAKMLGLSTDEVHQLRDARKIFGVRDGAGWKYKPQDIERYQQDQEGEGSGLGFSMPDDDDSSSGEISPLSDDSSSAISDDSESFDQILLSERELGESDPGASGTVIGKPGRGGPSDSDILLSEADEPPSPSKVKGDSDVTLVPDAAASPSDSGIKLVSGLQNTVELEMSDLAIGESGTDLPFDLGGSDTGSKAKHDSKVKPGSGIRPDSKVRVGGEAAEKPGSDLTLGSDVFGGGPSSGLGIGGSSLKLSDSGKKTGGSSGHGSGIELGIGEFEDDDLVLGSHVGSDINDSGISLGSVSDSGLSLEQPLELGGDDDEGSAVGELSADDEFLLTPAVEMGDEDSDSSGSQVIALDNEGEFDESAATMLGEMPAEGAVLEEDMFGGAAQPVDPLGGGMGAAAAMGMGPAPMMMPGQTVVAKEAPYGIGSIIMLSLCTVFMLLTGMFMFDLVRNMWTWDGPMAVNSSMMDGLLSLIGM